MDVKAVETMLNSFNMQQYRFTILLATLLSLMFFSPLVELLRTTAVRIVAPLLMLLLFSAVLLGAVYALARRRSTIMLASTWTAATIAVQSANLVLEYDLLLKLQNVLAGGMLAFAIALLLRSLFVEQQVTFEVIAASLCGYLLLGVLWANLYSLLELVQPASFAFSSSVAPAVDGDGPHSLRFGTARFATALYFSYVTLTTLGFGEITPATTSARMLCSVEAITGQLYLAVLVARLVGLHIVHQPRA